MTQWFPLPWISGFVFVGWLMVSGEITLLNVLTAILLAWLLPKWRLMTPMLI